MRGCMDTKKLIRMLGWLLVIFFFFRTDVFSEIVYSYVTAWPDKKPRTFDYPAGVAVGDGVFYVADRNNNRLLIITGSGDDAFIQEWGTEGSAVGQFDLPSGLALGLNNALYIADTGNHRIESWSTTDFTTKHGEARARRTASSAFPGPWP